MEKKPNFVKFIKPEKPIRKEIPPCLYKQGNALRINTSARNKINSGYVDVFYDEKLKVIDLRPGTYKKISTSIWCPGLPLPDGKYEYDGKYFIFVIDVNKISLTN